MRYRALAELPRFIFGTGMSIANKSQPPDRNAVTLVYRPLESLVVGMARSIDRDGALWLLVPGAAEKLF